MVSNTDDIIDSRDVQERIEELEDEIADIEDEDEAEELKEELDILIALREEVEQYNSEWYDGATLISDSYFEQYAEELADDIGAVDRNAGWPLQHIDWAAAAEELKQDYASVSFDGEEYWVRNT